MREGDGTFPLSSVASTTEYQKRTSLTMGGLGVLSSLVGDWVVIFVELEKVVDRGRSYSQRWVGRVDGRGG